MCLGAPKKPGRIRNNHLLPGDSLMPQPKLQERNIFDSTIEDLSDPLTLASLKKAIDEKVSKLRKARNLAALEETKPKPKKKRKLSETPVDSVPPCEDAPDV